MYDEDEDEDTTQECPYCRADIYDDAVACPRCGNYLSEEDSPSQTPRWIYWTALVCLVAAVGWALSAW